MSELALAIERVSGELARETRRRIRFGTTLPTWNNSASTFDRREPSARLDVHGVPRAWLARHVRSRSWIGVSFAANSPRFGHFSGLCCARNRCLPMLRRLLRTPKAPKRLPIVLTAEQTNNLVDGVGHGQVRAASSRSAMSRCSSCCMVAACGSANWWDSIVHDFDFARDAGFGCAARDKQGATGAVRSESVCGARKVSAQRPPKPGETALLLTIAGGG